jgi:hypothetical protein
MLTTPFVFTTRRLTFAYSSLTQPDHGDGLGRLGDVEYFIARSPMGSLCAYHPSLCFLRRSTH